MWKIEFRPAAAKSLRKLDKQTQMRITRFLTERVASSDHPKILATPLSGPFSGLFRFRVGDYRLIVEFKEDRLVVVVLDIGYRREVYR